MRLGINGRFLAARTATGIQRYATAVATRLCAALPDAVLLCPAGAGDLPAGACAVERGRMRNHRWEQLELPRMARRAQCDLTLHLASTAPLAGGPMVMVVHDVIPLTNPEWYTRRFAWWYRLALGRAARRAIRVITFSEWCRGEIHRVLGISPERIAVTTEGLAPFDRPATPEEVARVRAEHRLPDRYVLATGGDDPRKNVAFLVNMLREWPAADPPALVVTRSGASGVFRRAPWADAPGVRSVGYVPDADLRALYTGAVAFCHPARAEGFGRPPLEAMACGTPVLAAPYGSAAEILGDAATLVPLETRAWREALDRLARDEAHRAERAARGRAHAARFDWDTAAEQVAAVCHDAVRSMGGAA